MSERKDAEIKFRVTPTEKARWQQYAASADLGLSELIRREVNEGIRQNEKGLAVLAATAQAAREQYVVELPVVVSEEMPAGMCLITNLTGDADAPQEDPQPEAVGTSDEVGANWANVERHPWTFEAQNG